MYEEQQRYETKMAPFICTPGDKRNITQNSGLEKRPICKEVEADYRVPKRHAGKSAS